VLRRILLAVLLLGSSPSLAAPAEGIRRPQKLTVALSDELLGELAPDGKHLYFVSNRNSISQVFTQDLTAPRSTLLFDEAADNTWPRVSPDGKRLLYLSFRDDAAGQLCVRTLPGLARECLSGVSGALQASWLGNDQILLLARVNAEADLQLHRVRVGRTLRAEPFLSRNLAGMAISPDGAWLVFVPLERAGERLGPALTAQAARALVFRKLSDGSEVRVHLDLPGLTGQPSFSPDGKWLYFTQYLNDTDQSGVLDADDHGVIFRVPFAGDPSALQRGEPEQLTTAAWNCQYPAPSAKRLILTCARSGSLDVYSLPPDGIVPESWSKERVREEYQASRDQWERLLLVHRVERAERDPAARARMLLSTVRLHLELSEYEAAQHQTVVLAALPVPEAALAPVLEVLIAERRALRAFDRGQAGPRFLDDARRHVGEILQPRPGEPVPAAALRHLVASEVYDVIGDKPQAQKELELAVVDDKTPAFVVEMRAARVEALFRQLDLRDELLAGLRPLVDHPSLPTGARVRLSRVFARAVVLGLPAADAKRALDRELAVAPAGSPRAFGLLVEACLPSVQPSTLAAGRACMNDLYDRHPTPTERRLLVNEVIRRAEVSDADDLEYEIARRYVADVPRDSAERRHAERLFRILVEDQAYALMIAGKFSEAADVFEEVTHHTDSLEAVAGYIECAMLAGRTDVEQKIAARYPADSPIRRFARAYLEVRRLHDLDGAAFDRAAEAALKDVQAVQEALPLEAEPQALLGAILHQRFLEHEDHAAAEQANTHYLIALDLAGHQARYQAMVQEQLGQLHAQVGNHRIAISHFEDREQLPFADPLVEAGHHIVEARSFQHADRYADAAREAEEALTLVDKTPSLKRFEPLALDRAALYRLSAGDQARALELYDRALKNGGPDDANRVVQRLAHAAAALSAGQPARALADLDAVDAWFADPARRKQLSWPHTSPEEVQKSYDLLRLGLRGQAEHATGKNDAAWKTLSQRQTLLAARAKQRGLDDDLLALSLAEAQLADVARARNSLDEAGRWASQALEHADEYAKRTATPLADEQLATLAFAAELYLVAHVPRSAFTVDVAARLDDAFEKLSRAGDPKRASIRRRLGVYLTLMTLDGIEVQRGPRQRGAAQQRNPVE
jgi:hypothetical protein